ncbi:N-acetylglucosamine-6-phosphate deacetylase [Microbacterium sp. PRF11]|uniref:N-acetylglucosamine-6-phosphate deacetylase n=1 Tax=Microbacterium sp. PRF11 TaxID=2962593 RepID=UPI002880D832|nr:N-acetylglucosamine-6-phosphate deacetylase [Microbacterium sp. PRF11]MDT0116365.1 N-acetylglucosamine-6-phosphate deacetylase [Microbacterium sp. PRF11]
MSLLIREARVITGEPVEIARGWVHLADGVVREAGAGDPPPSVVSAVTDVVDAQEMAGAGALVTPGLVDIHTHGGGGSAFEDPDAAAAVDRILGVHAAHGVTRLVASLVSAAPIDLEQTIGALSAAARPGLLGIHLEGPCLDIDHRGAHDPRALRDPVRLDVDRLTAAGRLVQITIAPELPGALDLIRSFAAAGVRVAVGHTGADAATTREAIAAGATLLTHAFNAMPPLHHRAPGPVGVALADEAMTLELIADGTHVDPSLFAPLFRAAPGRIALVSDAMAAAGVGDGAFRLGGLDVTVADGVARLSGTDTIAGSTLTLDRAVRGVAAAGVPLAQAVAAATRVPARAVGRDQLGLLEKGCRADAVVWTRGLEPVAVWRDGIRLF